MKKNSIEKCGNVTVTDLRYRLRTKQIFVTKGENLLTGRNGGSKICIAT